MQLLRYRVKFARLDAIYISHLHGDHVLGLPGLLNTLSLYERNFPLKLFAPSGLKKILDTIFAQTQSYLTYDLEWVPLEDFNPGDTILKEKHFSVELLPLEHRIFCRGFRFVETNKRPKFDFYKAKSLNIPNQYFSLLKQGNTITLEDGREITPEAVLLAADPPLSYAYCSDTAYLEALIEHIRGSSLLYHEATFMHDLVERAHETCHSTAHEAAQVALRSGVRQLILGHFSARYKDLRPLLDEAQAIFPNTVLAREGNVYDLKHLPALVETPS